MPHSSSPLYVMKVGEATYCLKNHLVLCEIAKKLRQHLQSAGLLIDEEHYVREFATREQAFTFIHSQSVQQPVFVVIDDNVDVNRRADADYPQPKLLYFTGSFVAKEVVLGVGHKFKARCEEFARRCLIETRRIEDEASSIFPNNNEHEPKISAEPVQVKEPAPAAVKSLKEIDKTSREHKHLAECPSNSPDQLCFCLRPIADLLMQYHDDCADQELIEAVDKFLERAAKYESKELSSEDIKQGHSSMGKHNFIADIENRDQKLELCRKEASVERIEQSEETQEFDHQGTRSERLILEESLIKTLSLNEPDDFVKLEDDHVDPEVSMIFGAEKSEECNSAHDIRSPGTPTDAQKIDSKQQHMSPNCATPELKSRSTIAAAIIRTPAMEDPELTTHHTSTRHQMPEIPLGTNFKDILLEIENHKMTLSRVRTSFLANLSRVHEVLTQKLKDQIFCDMMNLNAKIENELKDTDDTCSLATLNCWVALLVFHSKLLNLLMLSAPAKLELPIRNFHLSRAATIKMVGVNPEEEIRRLLRDSIRLFVEAQEQHNLTDLVPIFFKNSHKIAVYITLVRLDQALSRLHSDGKSFDITMADASRLVRAAWDTLQATEFDIAEKYAEFYNAVYRILQARWELINEPFPDFAFTSTIEL